MDETSVHDLFERVTDAEPPIGSLAQRGIQAGIRLRRRRRVQNAVAGVAAIAVVAVVATTGIRGSLGLPAASGGSGTVYVYATATEVPTINQGGANITPIRVGTNTPSPPIAVSPDGFGEVWSMTATPDGKTIYVSDGSHGIQPVSTATGTAGKPIPIGKHQGDEDVATEIAAAPDGKTVYVVATDGSVTPISTATNTPGTPFQPGGTDSVTSVAVTPNGKTLYVGVAPQSSNGPNYVIPVSTATDQAGTPIRLTGGAGDIVITPDGRTAYVIGGATPGISSFSDKVAVTPITTATNTAGPMVIAGRAYVINSLVMTPDGQHIYVATANPFSLISFATATNAAKQISFGSSEIFALAAAPDGRTVYVASALNRNDSVRCPAAGGLVTPVATATSTPGKPFQVPCIPQVLAVTPDSKVVYAASYNSGHGWVTPIVAATGQPGTPIRVNGDPRLMLITP